MINQAFSNCDMPSKAKDTKSVTPGDRAKHLDGQVSLVDLTLYAIGSNITRQGGDSKKESGLIDDETNGFQKTMPMAFRSNRQGGFSDHREGKLLERSVGLVRGSESVLGTGGQTLREILVPMRGTDVSEIKSPFLDEERSIPGSTCARAAPILEPRGDSTMKIRHKIKQDSPPLSSDKSYTLSIQKPSHPKLPQAKREPSEKESTPLVSKTEETQQISKLTETMTTIDHQQRYQQQSQMQWADDSSRSSGSRAIAIKTRQRCAEELANSHSEITSERMYDWATWRMYNRIIDHRRNQRLSAASSLPPPAEQASIYHNAHSESSESQIPEIFYDGEVFELEI